MSIGFATSGAEVLQVSPYGLWLMVDGREYLLDHEAFPWFRDAPVGAIWNVQVDASGNLHWPDLDVDLERASLEDLESYPVVYCP